MATSLRSAPGQPRRRGRAGLAAAATPDGLEALRAVDRLVAARLERHLSLPPAVRAGRREHLARPAAAVAAGAAAALLVGAPALGAAARVVDEPPALVELLLAAREHELLSAVTAGQGAVL